MPLLGHDVPSGLVAIDPAKMRGVANGPADIRTAFQGAEPSRQCRGGTSGRSPGTAFGIPGVACRPVDFVVALKISELQRHVGLSEEVRARGLEAFDRLGIFLGDVVLEIGHTPSGGQPGDVVGLLDRHGHTVQRAPRLPLGQGLIRSVRRLARPLEIAHHHRIEFSIEPLDALDIEIRQLARTDRLGANGLGQLARR